MTAPEDKVEAPANVFLDTQVFITNNFHYGNRRLSSLVSLANAGDIQVFLTSVTVQEIDANLKKLVLEAHRPRPDKILANSRIPAVEALFIQVPKDDVLSELRTQFERFLTDVGAEVLDVDGASLEPVLDNYFGRQAPFGSGKNKAEFPDAFAIDTLRRWCTDNDADMAVVSADAGFRAACVRGGCLRSYEKIEQYLDAVVGHSDALRAFIAEMIESQSAALSTEFERAFSSMGFSLVDQVDGDVEYAELLTYCLQDEVEILSLSATGASVEMAVELEFRADLLYCEEGTGFYDPDEGRLLHADEIADSVQRSVIRKFDFDVAFTNLDAKSFKLERVWLAGDPDVEIESYPAGESLRRV